jgi:hypothetical protein
LGWMSWRVPYRGPRFLGTLDPQVTATGAGLHGSTAPLQAPSWAAPAPVTGAYLLDQSWHRAWLLITALIIAA